MWSENLQKQTVEHFKKLPMAAMKQVDGIFGFCILYLQKWSIYY